MLTCKVTSASENNVLGFTHANINLKLATVRRTIQKVLGIFHDGIEDARQRKR